MLKGRTMEVTSLATLGGAYLGPTGREQYDHFPPKIPAEASI